MHASDSDKLARAREHGPARRAWATGSGIAIGIGAGVAVGVAIGNLAVGIAVGVAAGVAIDFTGSRANR